MEFEEESPAIQAEKETWQRAARPQGGGIDIVPNAQ